jgi:DNA-binding NarL/FixJ family response regulator
VARRGPYNEYIRRGPSKELTEPELMVLRYLSHGLTLGMTAEAVAKSFHTVNSQLRTGREKLGAKTKTQAVAEAIRQGLIP